MRSWLTATLCCLACTGEILSSPKGGAAPGPGGETPLDPVTPVEPTPSEPLPPSYPAAGVRRLTRAEAVAAATALLGVEATALGDALGPDVRQGGYTRNADQRVGSVQADALWSAAEALAREAVAQRLQALAPCSSSAGSASCAASFVSGFGAKAFRRSLSAGEAAGLVAVYGAAQPQGGHAAGVALVIQAVLQSASFLYVTELGSGGSGPTRLTADELATQLALLMTGAPPPDELVARARAGELDGSEGRAAAARALLAAPAGRAQVERLVLEWLSADDVGEAAKDEARFPRFSEVRGDMLAEARAMVDATLDGDDRLQTLLSLETTVRSAALAGFYGEPGSGATGLPSYRRGLLTSGAFTAANAHPADTSPVKRGAVVRRRLLCQELPLPTGLGPIVVPAPDPSLTTRERFAVHSQSEACAGCHRLLDPIGFALESFDAAGRYRTTENGKPIDPSGELVGAGEVSGPFGDAVGLAQRLARSSDVGRCFARHVYRFASGRSGGDAERTFVDFARARQGVGPTRVAGLLVDYVASDTFLYRSP